MKISLNWLQEFIELSENDPKEIVRVLTEKSAEVEEILDSANMYDSVVTGKLMEFEKIGGSDKLHKGIFDCGKIGEKEVVFGSVFPLQTEGIYPVGLSGTILPGGIEIKNTKIMGVVTEGMVCSDEELSIHFTSEGLLRFPKNTPLGKPVFKVLREAVQNVVIGYVFEVQKHPNADSLNIARVKISDNEILEIVCGGVNLRENIKVPVALVGANLWGNFEIKPAKIRDVKSNGMICSSEELGVGLRGHKEIYILPDSAPVGKSFFDFVFENAITLDIDNKAITNRPDLFSHLGFAREFVALGLGKWRTIPNDELQITNQQVVRENVIPAEGKRGGSRNLTNYTLQITSEFVNDDVSVSPETFKEYPAQIQKKVEDILEKIPGSPLPVEFDVQNPEICPARAEIVLENITIAPSPHWMQKRLQECGIRSINNIVDVSNYVMLELGIPLHCFDFDTISGKKIIMRESKEGEKVVTIDGITRELPEGVILQEDEEKIFDLAGIMGGENSEISEKTTRVLVHVPVYEPIRIRKAALALGHRTHASTLYEKRVPNSSVLPGILRTIQLISEMCPEMKIASKIEYAEHTPAETRILSLPKKMANRIIGADISADIIKNILESLDFVIEKQSEEDFSVRVPKHRFQDISIPEDLVEEIARIYGFNTISALAPEMNMRSSSLSPIRKVRSEVADFLVSKGFFEALNFAFLGPELLQMCDISPDETFVQVQNPLSADQSLMRQSLLPRLFETAMENRKHRGEFSFFEIGKTFVRQSDKDVSEAVMLSGILCGKDFFETKGILEALFEVLHFPFRFAEGKELNPFSAFGANILLGNNTIGEISVPKKSIRNTFDLPEKSSIFSLDLSKIADFPRKHISADSAPKFPEITLDLSVLSDKNVFSCDILCVVSKIDPLIVSSEVTEIYEGGDLPDGKKSVTLRFVFRAGDRTLSSEEADFLRKKILNALEKKGFPFRF